MVTVWDVANFNFPVTVLRWYLSSKRGGCAGETLFLLYGQTVCVTRHGLSTPSPVSTWKDWPVLYTETFLLGSLICMSLQYTHHPPKSPFLFILIKFHIVFLYVQYSTFISHCVDVLMNGIYCTRRRSSPCTWSYISTKMQICKRASCDSC